MIKGLEGRTYEERLRAGMSRLGAGWGSLMYLNTRREGARRKELGSFQCCPSKGPEAMGTKGNTESSI